jgi:hypothetical protein
LFVTDAAASTLAPDRAAALAERREDIAGLVAEKALALMCAVQQRALEAEAAADVVQLTGAFTKLARAVRQSVALQAKLEADRRRARQTELREAADGKMGAVIARRTRVRAAVERACWDEYEPEEEIEDYDVEMLRGELELLLDDAAAAPDFLETPVETLVARLCTKLGVTPPDLDAPPIFARLRGPTRDSDRDASGDTS